MVEEVEVAEVVDEDDGEVVLLEAMEEDVKLEVVVGWACWVVVCAGGVVEGRVSWEEEVGLPGNDRLVVGLVKTGPSPGPLPPGPLPPGPLPPGPLPPGPSGRISSAVFAG